VIRVFVVVSLRRTVDDQRVRGTEVLKTVPVVRVTTLADQVDASIVIERLIATLSGLFGALGSVLTAVGIYGLLAYTVARRANEIGIRMALGAQRKHVLQAALGPAVKLLLFGSVAGLILGILASRVLASIVYQATSRDPLVLAGVVVAMSLLGLLATWIPAQRAFSIDPALSLGGGSWRRFGLITQVAMLLFVWLTAQFTAGGEDRQQERMQYNCCGHIEGSKTEEV
jgi:ABC-type antimicrobial peptide transport system permease subunit